jgi:hypothetical protein
VHALELVVFQSFTEKVLLSLAHSAAAMPPAAYVELEILKNVSKSTQLLLAVLVKAIKVWEAPVQAGTQKTVIKLGPLLETIKLSGGGLSIRGGWRGTANNKHKFYP